LASPKSSRKERTSILIPRTLSLGEGRVRLFKQKSLPLCGGRLSFGFFLCFTPYDYLPPVTLPMVIIDVIMVLLSIIF
jgi:hypothetical protein